MLLLCQCHFFQEMLLCFRNDLLNRFTLYNNMHNMRIYIFLEYFEEIFVKIRRL